MGLPSALKLRISAANEKKRLVYASNSKEMAGKSKAGVVSETWILSNNGFSPKMSQHNKFKGWYQRQQFIQDDYNPQAK